MKKTVNLVTLGVFMVSNILTPLTNFIYATETETVEEVDDIAVVRDVIGEDAPVASLETSPEATDNDSAEEVETPAVDDVQSGESENANVDTPAIEPSGWTQGDETSSKSSESHDSATTPSDETSSENLESETQSEEDREITLNEGVTVTHYPDNDITYTLNWNENFTAWTITIISWSTTITMLDRNLWARTYDIDSPDSYGYHFQWWNNYGFDPNAALNIGITQVSASSITYNPSQQQYYSSSTYIRWYDNWLDNNNVVDLWWWTLNDRTFNLDNNTRKINNPTYRRWPCPQWFHVPSLSEWSKVLSIIWYDRSMVENDLKMPKAGYRQYYNNTSVSGRGYTAHRWTSSPYSAYTKSIGYEMYQWENPYWTDIARANAYSVRCFYDLYEAYPEPEREPVEIIYDPNGWAFPWKTVDETIVITYTSNGWKYTPDINIQNPNNTGNIFGGWYTDTTYTTKWLWNVNRHTQSQTVYAKRLPFDDLELYFLQKNGTLTHYTIMDRNMWATEAYNQDYDHPNTNSYGYHYQWWNNHGFAPCIWNGCKTFPWWETMSSTRVPKSEWDIWPSKYARNVFVWGNWNWRSGVTPTEDNIWWWAGDLQKIDWTWIYSGLNIWKNNERDVVKNRQWPCPDDYYIPSQLDWDTIIDTRKNSNTIDSYEWVRFSSDLLLPFAGSRNNSTTYDNLSMNEPDAGKIFGQWGGGDYWSSTNVEDIADYAMSLWILSSSSSYSYYGSVFVEEGEAAYAHSIRCAKRYVNDKAFNIHGEWAYTVVAFTWDIWEWKITALWTPSRENYIFRWWYSDANYQHEVNVWDTVPSDLYAKWEALELYTITYVDPLNATNNNPTIYNVTTADITLTNLFKDDNTNFEWWYTDAEYQNKVKWVAIPQWSTWERTFYAKWSCKKWFVMEGEKCIFPWKMATLIEWSEFNATLKSLAWDPYGDYVNMTDTKIKWFVWKDSLPEWINPEDIEKISIDGSSDVPVYAWFDQAGYSNWEWIIYYTSEADKIYMNQRSDVMFRYMQGLISLDLSNLDTSKVANLSNTFQGCSNLTSLNLDNWDLSKLWGNYGNMFYESTSLKTLSLKNWIAPSDVQQLLSSYKAGLSAQLDRIDVSGWNLRNTTSLYYLFGDNHTKEIIGLNTWDTSNITNMSFMFFQCDNLKSLDLSNFDTSNVTTMYLMFYRSSNLKSLDLSNFDTSNVTTVSNMFAYCSSLKLLNLDNWNLSSLIFDSNNTSNIANIFGWTSSLKTLSLKNWVLPENASSLISNRSPGLSAQLDWIDVSDWDLSKTTNIYALFAGSNTKQIIWLDTWDTSNIENMSQIFYNCNNLEELDLSNWDTSNVTNMWYMFAYSTKLTSVDVSSWDTSNVTNMSAMFYGCSNLTSLKLDNWDLSQSPNMYNMFNWDNNLKELSLKNWIIPTSFHQILSADTSSTSTGSFLTAQLDWIDVSGWDLSQTTDISWLFKQSKTKAIIWMDTWDTSNIIDMGNLFNWCANLTSLNLDNWYLVNIDAMINIFQWTSWLKTLSLKHWVLPTTFIYMLWNYPTQLAAQLDWIDVSDWDLSHTTTIEWLFANSYTKKIIWMDTWDTSNLQSMRNMFLTAHNLTKVDVSNWDLSNLTDVSAMFQGSNISEVVWINTWKNTSNITNMADMFKESRNLKSVDFGNFDASGVQTMNNMFNECDGLTTLDLWGIDTRNVKNMSAMFAWSDKLEELDLSSWNTESATNMLQMFVACPKLKTIYATDQFVTTNTTISDAMFYLDSVLVGWKWTTYTESHTNKEYARIDEGTSNPGYFTKANTITYNLNGWERESGNEWRTAYSPLSSFTLPTPVREWYTFIWWTGSNGKKPKKEVKIQEYTYWDLTYTANWEINNYKIIFDTDGWNEIAPIEVEYNSVLSGIELPVSSKECNGFAWWDKELPETMPAEDITLKAVWNYVCREYSWWWGWWGGGSSAIDTVKESVDKNTHNAADDKEWTSEDDVKESTDSSNTETSESTYSEEFTEAYKFAKSNGITTKPNIQEAKMNSTLTRIQMAKMLSYYAINVLWQDPDMTQTIKFEDVSDKRDAEYDNGVTLAYQLGIMWINMKNNKFRPDDEVTRAEFVTALSRMIYGMKDGTWNMKYYEPHMARMYNEWIISNTNPKMKEKRWYVMIMLMRTVK